VDTLFWLLFLPVVMPFVAKVFLHRTLNYKEVGVNVLVVVVIIPLLYHLAVNAKMSDIEILNGQVTDKRSVRVSCEHSYSCNCKTNSDGHTSCDTCYRHSYDIDWVVYSTVGRFNINRVNSQGTVEPPRWTAVQIGEPVARESTYKNYILGADFSLFKEEQHLVHSFGDKIPSYPRVHDYHRINRVLTVQVQVPRQDVNNFNHLLNDRLKTLGPKHQVNIVSVIVNESDPNYRYAVEQAWKGGKKNDVIVLFGITQYPTIDWADIITFARNTGNEHFRVVLRDNLMKTKTFDYNQITDIITGDIQSSFKRPRMEQFEYLANDVHLDTKILFLLLAVSIVLSLGITYYFHRNEF